MAEKAVISASGGLDSTTCVAIAHNQGYDLHMLHVTYKQRTAERELKAFHEVADHYEVPQKKRLIVDIDYLRQIGGSALTDTSIPIPEADLDSEEVPISYCPFRNANLLAIAVSWAETIKATTIFIGANAIDTNYPDCCFEFYEIFNRLIAVGTRPETSIEVVTPLIHLSKGEIVKTGSKLGAPYQLSWSCYSNTDVACSRCNSCLLRLRGFREAGVNDPIPYEDDSICTRY